MKIKSLLTLIVGLALVTIPARAFIFGNGTQITVASNSPVILTSYATVSIPSVTVQISNLTNGVTQCTNSFSASTATTGTNATPISSSTFNAGGSTSTQTTNYSSQTITVPIYIIMQTVPQSGGSNTYAIQAN